MNTEQLKQFAFLALDDDEGIPSRAYDILNDALVEAGLGYICDAVRITEDRAYLPEGMAELLKEQHGN